MLMFLTDGLGEMVLKKIQPKNGCFIVFTVSLTLILGKLMGKMERTLTALRQTWVDF